MATDYNPSAAKKIHYYEKIAKTLFKICVFASFKESIGVKKKDKRAILGGLAVGGVNGLFGGGGGMVAVPMLTNVLEYGQKEAHATAIFVIAPVCAVSVITYVINGYIDLSVLVPSTIGNIIGGLLGAKFLGKLPKLFVQLSFIAVMLVAGVRMILG